MRRYRILLLSLLLSAQTFAVAFADSFTVTLNGSQSTVSIGTPITFTVQAMTSPPAPAAPAKDSAFSGTVTVTGSDAQAAYSPSTLTITAGVGSISVTFMTPGSQVVIVQSSGQNYTSAPITVESTVAGCSSCFAAIGAGAVRSNLAGDYNDTNNVLVSTHIGTGTPQYSLGVAYKLPIPGFFYKLPNLNVSRPASTCPNQREPLHIAILSRHSSTLNSLRTPAKHSMALHTACPTPSTRIST